MQPVFLTLAGLALAAMLPAHAQPAGNATRGKQLYEARCLDCHAVDAHKVGPSHRGVFGRKAGTAPGYAYSPALAASGLRWDAHNLQAWLANPEKLVPGQKMFFSVDAAAERADIVAYLARLR